MKAFAFSGAAADPALQQKALCAGAACGSFLGGVWAWLQEAALTVLGVPLPVVLFAAFGAFAAGTYRPQRGLARSLASSLAWMVVGIALAQLAAALAARLLELSLPAPALALVAAGGARLLVPYAIERAPAWMEWAAERWLKRPGNGHGGGND